jgi:transcriptional regulator GlxA family with amidase domain
MSTMDIAVVLFDGFDNLDAIGPFEVFSHARRFGADLEVGLYTLEERELVTSSHGLRIQPDGVLPGSPDLVVVPGGGWGDRAESGAWAEAERGELPEALAERYADGATVASVCTGGMLLAEAGLTDGRPAITHRSAIDDLRESGAEVVEARVVDDGDLLTAGGITAGIDLALHILEREFGAELADQVEGVMEYEARGEVFKP